MYFLLSSMSVVCVLTTPIAEDGRMLPWNKSGRGTSGTMTTMFAEKDFKYTLKHQKEELTLVELGSHLRIEESLRMQDNDKPRSNNVADPSVVNMVKHNNGFRYTDNSSKHKHHDNTSADPNKKAKPTCWKCDKTGHIKRDCKGVNVSSKTNGSGISGSGNGLVPLKG
ncbi:zinc finger, CCHC-type containing protein [Tanacetum coccineum]